jgi:hypothetical protein
MQNKVPLRPPGNFKLTQDECDCLTWYILKGCAAATAYGLFVRKDLVFNKTTLKAASKQFFASQAAIAYMNAYNRIISGEELPTKHKDDDEEVDTEGKLQETLKSLIKWASEQSKKIDNLDKDTAALVIKILDNVGLFDNLEAKEEKPRRYLPVRCQSECQYRLCIEQFTKEGKVLNECDYCQARKYAESSGYKYDPTKNLNIPNDVLAEYDLENYTIIDGAED